MTIEIEERFEPPRGCGYRQPGGKYLVSGGLMVPCGRLPIRLHVCPVCSSGIKATRAWTWIDPRRLLVEHPEYVCGKTYCDRCPLGGAIPERAGLLWVGGKFYASPEAFSEEALRMGVSRRIPAVPHGFVLGETRVFLAHREVRGCGREPDEETGPGVFHAFRPERVEYVVRTDDPPEKLERLVKQGFTLVDVKRVQGTLPVDANDAEE